MKCKTRQTKEEEKADPRGLSSVKNQKVKPSDTIAEHIARTNMDILFHGWSQLSPITFLVFYLDGLIGDIEDRVSLWLGM